VAESTERGRRECGHGLLLVKTSSTNPPSCCRDRYGGRAIERNTGAAAAMVRTRVACDEYSGQATMDTRIQEHGIHRRSPAVLVAATEQRLVNRRTAAMYQSLCRPAMARRYTRAETELIWASGRGFPTQGRPACAADAFP
jgi:hypothetical protein